MYALSSVIFFFVFQCIWGLDLFGPTDVHSIWWLGKHRFKKAWGQLMSILMAFIIKNYLQRVSKRMREIFWVYIFGVVCNNLILGVIGLQYTLESSHSLSPHLCRLLDFKWSIVVDLSVKLRNLTYHYKKYKLLWSQNIVILHFIQSAFNGPAQYATVAKQKILGLPNLYHELILACSI